MITKSRKSHRHTPFGSILLITYSSNRDRIVGILLQAQSIRHLRERDKRGIISSSEASHIICCRDKFRVPIDNGGIISDVRDRNILKARTSLIEYCREIININGSGGSTEYYTHGIAVIRNCGNNRRIDTYRHPTICIRNIYRTDNYQITQVVRTSCNTHFEH